MNGYKAFLDEWVKFEFGSNWARFLRKIEDKRICIAKESLRNRLKIDTMNGKTFLDVGCGSGLFSLAARQLGAKVHSFDYDPQSVACTAELKRRYFPNDTEWKVEEGSVLDIDYLARLGEFDVVYSWGVLHHTGAMWQALENVVPLVLKERGRMFIAIYNNQGRQSRIWLRIKRIYNAVPPPLRWLILYPATLRLWGLTIVRDLLRGRPFQAWQHYAEQSVRGMSAWNDVVDWVGGLPFEVAKPEEVFEFYRASGFQLDHLKTCAGGHGCNEFVFTRVPSEGTVP